MAKEENVGETVGGVRIIPVSANGANSQITIPTASQVGNGLAVIPLPGYGQYPGWPSPPAAAAPSTILIVVEQKSDKDKPAKKKSSVFQRL